MDAVLNIHQRYERSIRAGFSLSLSLSPPLSSSLFLSPATSKVAIQSSPSRRQYIEQHRFPPPSFVAIIKNLKKFSFPLRVSLFSFNCYATSIKKRSTGINFQEINTQLSKLLYYIIYLYISL